MIRYLTFISFTFLLLSCTPKLAPVSNFSESVRNSNVSLYEPIVFRSAIEFAGNTVTGIMAIKQRSDESLAGSFINEFGVKGFDFTYVNEKIDLVYVMPLLDRYLIRQTLKHDVALLMKYGISEIGTIMADKDIDVPKILYPVTRVKTERVRISFEYQNKAKMLLLEDFRRKLTIKLVTINTDAEK